jgi:2'-5' RNA ligase
MTQISPIAELEATRLARLFKYSEDQPRDDHGRFGEGSATSAANKAAEVFGLPKPTIHFSTDASGKVSGEHGGETINLVNVHLQNKFKGLNFTPAAGVGEAEHIAAHEVAHQAFSKDSDLGHAMMERLSRVNAAYGSSVSIYGAFSGQHENLMELGAAYSHSPAELKAYSPEMFAIGRDWSHALKRGVGKLFKYSPDQPRTFEYPLNQTPFRWKGVAKAAPSLPPANPDDQSEAAKRARRNIKREVGDTLDGMRDRVPGEAADAYEANDNATEAMDAINLDDFDDLATGAIPAALHDVYINAGQKALDSLGVDDTSIVDLFNKRAADYARERGAELVGKRWVNDALVENPDARWAISQTTRDGLRDMIVKSYEDGKTPVQLAKQIEDSYLFSESRAEMIAFTETAKASVGGTLGAWQESGVVKGKAWQMSNDHDQDDECNDNEEAGVIGLDEDFPSGDDGPPAHPRCMCAVYASLEGPDDDEDTEKLAKLFTLEKHDYGCMMVDIPTDSEVGQLMTQLRGEISTDDLAGDGLVTDMHVTVRYGIKPGSDLNRLHTYFQSLSPFEITFSKVTSFPPTPQSDDAAVIKVDVASPELQAINAALPDHVDFKEANFEYHPHATIAYVKPEAVGKYVGSGMLDGKKLTVTAITIRNIGDPDVVEFEKLAKYDPDQERDDHGRWSQLGAGGKDPKVLGALARERVGAGLETPKAAGRAARAAARVAGGGPKTRDVAAHVGRAAGIQVLREQGQKYEPQPMAPRLAPKQDDDEHHLSTAEVASTKDLGGGINETRFVMLKDGSAGVFKPESGAYASTLRDNITPGGDIARERGAWEVAKVVCMKDMVPMAVERTIDGQRGVLMAFKQGVTAHNLPPDARYDGKEDLARAAMFDHVIGNEDRHAGNWLVEGNHLHLIDHGLAFPDRDEYRGGVYGNHYFVARAANPFAALEKGPSEYAKPYISARTQVLAACKRAGLPPKAIAGVDGRIRNLANVHSWRDL